MVLTLKSYAPVSKISDVSPGDIVHPAGKGLLNFNVRILDKVGEVIINFGQLTDLLSWTDTLSTKGASGTWTLNMGASLCYEVLIRSIHPGAIIEVYCARNKDPLITVFGSVFQKGAGVFDMKVSRLAKFNVVPKTADSLDGLNLATEFHLQFFASEIQQVTEHGKLDLPDYWASN